MISGIIRLLSIIAEWMFLRWKRETAQAESEITEIEDFESAATAGDEQAVQDQFRRWHLESELDDPDRFSGTDHADGMPDAET